jgi:hypothetical protein
MLLGTTPSLSLLGKDYNDCNTKKMKSFEKREKFPAMTCFIPHRSRGRCKNDGWGLPAAEARAARRLAMPPKAMPRSHRKHVTSYNYDYMNKNADFTLYRDDFTRETRVVSDVKYRFCAVSLKYRVNNRLSRLSTSTSSLPPTMAAATHICASDTIFGVLRLAFLPTHSDPLRPSSRHSSKSVKSRAVGNKQSHIA